MRIGTILVLVGYLLILTLELWRNAGAGVALLVAMTLSLLVATAWQYPATRRLASVSDWLRTGVRRVACDLLDLMTRRTTRGLVAGIFVGLVGFGLRKAGYDTLFALLTTMLVVAVVVRLYRGLAESKYHCHVETNGL